MWRCGRVPAIVLMPRACEGADTPAHVAANLKFPVSHKYFLRKQTNRYRQAQHHWPQADTRWKARPRPENETVNVRRVVLGWD